MPISYLPSIEKASDVLIDAINNDKPNEIKEVLDYINNNEISGSASAFHNAAASLARIDAFAYAISILEVGLNRYSRDTDLLADIISYGSKCKKLSDVNPYYKKLKRVRKCFWTWRAYVFSVDFLMEYIQYTETEKEEERIKAEILSILSDFKATYPHDERAYVAESEFYECMHDYQKQIAALIEGMEKVAVCCQCALKYADYLFERGEYEKALPIIQKAVDIREDQPSISLGYAYYILAMSKEAVLRRKTTQLTEQAVVPVFDAYNIAFSFMESEPGRKLLLNQIEKRVIALEIESGIKCKIDFHEKNGIDIDNSIARFVLEALAQRSKNEKDCETDNK